MIEKAIAAKSMPEASGALYMPSLMGKVQAIRLHASIMPRIIAATVLAALLIACSSPMDTKLDASSKEKAAESISNAKAKLTPEERSRFEQSLQVISLSKLDTGNGLLGMMAQLQNPDLITANILDDIHGKSPAEIIKKATDIKRGNLIKSLESINDEIKELQDKKAAHDASAAVLKPVSVMNPKFRWTDARLFLSAEPIVEFDITNKAGKTLSAVHFHGKVITPGREMPWIDEDFSESFPGGLEQGETRHVKTFPGIREYGWKVTETKGRKDLVLTVEVVNAEGADGEKLVAEFSDRDKARLAELLKQKSDTESELAALQ